MTENSLPYLISINRKLECKDGKIFQNAGKGL